MRDRDKTFKPNGDNCLEVFGWLTKKRTEDNAETIMACVKVRAADGV